MFPCRNLKRCNTEFAAVQDLVANLLLGANSAAKQNESVCFVLWQKIMEADLIKERESGLKRQLNALEVKTVEFESELRLVALLSRRSVRDGSENW